MRVPPDVVPDVGPDAGPDVGPDAGPDVGPDAVPSVVPGVARDVLNTERADSWGLHVYSVHYHETSFDAICLLIVYLVLSAVDCFGTSRCLVCSCSSGFRCCVGWNGYHNLSLGVYKDEQQHCWAIHSHMPCFQHQ